MNYSLNILECTQQTIVKIKLLKKAIRNYMMNKKICEIRK